MLIVLKFGGTSLLDRERILRAARRARALQQQGAQVVVVVSARGHTTDAIVADMAELCRTPDAREADMCLSSGEQLSAGLMALALRSLGCDAVSLTGGQAGLVTDSCHGNARVITLDSRRIRQELAGGKVVVVAGFQGISESGDITTLGRGGSDTTAVALAAAIGADVCRIYTDVKGVYSADPRVVEQARVHREISYDEMLEMAALGAQVLHSRAVELAREKQVRVEVRSTFSPEDGGTALCRESTAERGVRGIACDDNVAMVTVMGLGSGAGTCRLFGLLAESGIAIDVIIRSPGSGSGRVRFSVSADDSDRVTALLRSCQQELGFSGFLIHPGMAKVSVVGDGLGGGCGVAAKMLQALQAGGIEPAYITTGDKRTSVIVGKDQACPAVRLLHTAFFGE